jgi:hypothetical protein
VVNEVIDIIITGVIQVISILPTYLQRIYVFRHKNQRTKWERKKVQKTDEEVKDKRRKKREPTYLQRIYNVFTTYLRFQTRNPKDKKG